MAPKDAGSSPVGHPELLQGRPGAGVVQVLAVRGMPAQRVQRERPGVGEDLLRVPHQERNADSPSWPDASTSGRQLVRETGDAPAAVTAPTGTGDPKPAIVAATVLAPPPLFPPRIMASPPRGRGTLRPAPYRPKPRHRRSGLRAGAGAR